MKAGTTFIVTSGEYSDYGISGTFETLKAFSLDVELERWLSDRPEQRFSYGFRDHDFMDSLVERDLIRHVDIKRVHLHDYHTAIDKPADDAGDVATEPKCVDTESK